VLWLEGVGTFFARTKLGLVTGQPEAVAPSSGGPGRTAEGARSTLSHTRLRHLPRARTAESAASDEHVLPAVFGKRLALEPTLEGLQLERGVEEPQPLVLRCSPQRAPPAHIECDVDPVIAHGVSDRVWHELVLMLAIEARRDPIVEGEGVPRETPPWPERGGDALEAPAATPPGRQMQEAAKRGVDQRCGRVEGEVRMSHWRRSSSTPAWAARDRASSSIAGEVSIPITRSPVARATEIATRPFPTASSTTGPFASRAARERFHAAPCRGGGSRDGRRGRSSGEPRGVQDDCGMGDLPGRDAEGNVTHDISDLPLKPVPEAAEWQILSMPRS
jgi:hypothetical protein